MAPSISDGFSDGWRTFWHAITSNDRHATHDSPYRTGQHVPLAQSRHAPLTSVATSAIESRVDLNSLPRSDSLDVNGHKSPNGGATSPGSPYSPGLISAQRRVSSSDRNSTRGSIDKSPAAEIQLQSFSEGLPPPPPVSHSWKRIERWLEDNYGELFDNLCEGCTQNDVNELEHTLDCTLPLDVRDSIQFHDGQERGGRPTGILFGCMLLDCEEIVEEWSNWRAVNEQYLSGIPGNYRNAPQIAPKAFAGPSSSSQPPVPIAQAQPSNGIWKEELLGKQDSQPPNAVQKVYAHPSWIPMARDWGGNCLGVDLAPGPTGTWGQVIIFGRDYDCKFVVARSWAAFMATLADDLTSGDKVFVDEETGDLKLRPFKAQGVEPPYLEILRWRCDQKYGRKPPRKRASGGLRINPNAPGPSFDSFSGSSPYASPTSAGSERGRSPHRFNGKQPLNASPLRPHISSPLARVAEEIPAPLKVRTDSDTVKNATSRVQDKLISVDSPRHSGDFPSPAPLGPTSMNKENVAPSNGNPTEPATVTKLEKIEAKPEVKEELEKKEEAVDEMKTVAI